MRPIFLSYLTAPVDDPFEALHIAAEAGYSGLGLRLSDPATGAAVSPLVGDPGLCRRFVDALNDGGLRVPEIEARVLSRGSALQIAPEVLQAAAMLGQPCLIAVADQRSAIELPELCDRFGALCAEAAAFGLEVGFEPIAHRAAGSLDEALSIVAAGAGQGARLVLDALHLHRMGVTPDRLARVDHALMRAFHICDAPPIPPDLAGHIDHSARNRLLPGQGVLPLSNYLAALPPDMPVSLEIPMMRAEGIIPLAKRARIAIAATSALLEKDNHQ